MAFTPTGTVRLADLDHAKAAILKRVLSTVLCSRTTKDVFAQVIDGLPIKSTYELTITRRYELLSRMEPSQRSRLLSGQFCSSSELFDSLNLNARTAELYQMAPLYSQTFNLYLLELVAVAVHDLAATLFHRFHPDGEPRLERVNEPSSQQQQQGPISLSTMCYLRRNIYPRGVCDVVGYWAEAHVFARKTSRTDFASKSAFASQCYAAYVHPPYPADMFQLVDHQIEQFAALASQQKNDTCILPFICSPGARKLNPNYAFLNLNIYRDRYERQLSPIPRGGYCVRRLEDDSDLKNFINKANQMFSK
ncbi:hypothetical protein AJ78_08342 [Emergomyces pasteurianus Ep9510]|uniref:Uncharacterized protein n=1 Tax=Emergomyces pasteurianus Ep9510 TaxID=1447872 RepID=A0A1J9Q471_9EURO|nr:hypothetical protein AJ78_08342 [Emergomyces pasteurianus Ep9510]